MARAASSRRSSAPDLIIDAGGRAAGVPVAVANDAGVPVAVANDARWARIIDRAGLELELCHLDAHVGR